MTEDRNGPEDPIIRRIQQAFAHEEPATELPEVLRRAAGYLAAAPEDAGEQEGAGRGLTMADLAAASRREPAAVSRLYSAYAPPLFCFFLAAVGDRPTAEDLTGSVFAAAIEGLPGFGGAVEALPGWLYRIANSTQAHCVDVDHQPTDLAVGVRIPRGAPRAQLRRAIARGATSTRFWPDHPLP
jgi:Sigma-70 region 2